MPQEIRVFCPVHTVYEVPQVVQFIAGGIQFFTPGHPALTWDGKIIGVSLRSQSKIYKAAKPNRANRGNKNWVKK